jgi:hypothetical protein
MSPTIAARSPRISGGVLLDPPEIRFAVPAASVSTRSAWPARGSATHSDQSRTAVVDLVERGYDGVPDQAETAGPEPVW